MRCKCGAIWRVNYPYGRKSKSKTTFQVDHKHWCDFAKTNKRIKR